MKFSTVTLFSLYFPCQVMAGRSVHIDILLAITRYLASRLRKGPADLSAPSRNTVLMHQEHNKESV